MEKQVFHLGIFAKMSFPKLVVFFSLVDVFHPQNMFWLDVVGVCFKGVFIVVSSLLLFCCLGVWERAFFRSNLSLVLAFFGFAVFSVRVLLILCFSACLVFFYGLCFVYLECSSSSWDCLSLIALSCCCLFYFMFWLLVSLCGFLGCLLTGTIPVGPLGVGNSQKRSGDPNPQYFSKSTAVQMGGVLPYKWEAYCSTNGRRIAAFPFLRSLEARKVRRYKWGAYCRTNWRCTAVLFRQAVGVGVSETLLKQGGVNIFFGFSHNRGVWVKTGAVPQGDDFCNFFASETCI